MMSHIVLVLVSHCPKNHAHGNARFESAAPVMVALELRVRRAEQALGGRVRPKGAGACDQIRSMQFS